MDGPSGRVVQRNAAQRYLWRSARVCLPFISHAYFLATMDQSLARRTLQELIKRDDLKNKSCVDCGNPNPQWASLRFAPFIPFRWPLTDQPSQLRCIHLLTMRGNSQRFWCAH
jgi:hypothetical protein